MKYTIIILLGFLVITVFLLSPKCLVIEQELMTTTLNLEERIDTDGMYPFKFRVFQKKEGEWYQCKTRVSRFFFA